MSEDIIIEDRIEQAFRTHPWRGLIPVEEAIADAIRYRQSLCTEDRKVYDQQILSGRHPSKALETVEILSGRDMPQGAETTKEPVAK